MPVFDLPIEELERHRSTMEPPFDLTEFWASTIAEARENASGVSVIQVDTGLEVVRTWDVTFSGFAGQPIRAWYHRPAGTDAPLPAVVRYQGYGGGRGFPHQPSIWALAGYACLEMDTRGQGSVWSPGDTADPVGSGPAHPGFLTRGILDPSEYYYRRLYTDAVMAVDAVKELPGADPEHVAVAGASQGGGMAIAVGSLRDDLTAVMTDVPFLSDFRRAADLATRPPYIELTTYLSTHRDRIDQVFSTLAYFDVSVLARTARAPALFSVAIMDQTCPPSTVYAAYNAYAGPKEIRRYRYNDHEGGKGFQEAEQLRWIKERMPLTG